MTDALHGDALVLGLYNKNNNLYVESANKDGSINRYNFKNASIFKAVRSAMVNNIKDFDKLTTLGGIEVFAGNTVEDLLTVMLPEIIAQTSNKGVEKNGNVYTLEIKLSKIVEYIKTLLPSLELGNMIPKEIVFNFAFTSNDKALTGVDLKAYIESNNAEKTDLQFDFKSNNGTFFGEVDKQYAPTINSELENTAETSVLQTYLDGSINMMKANGVVKTYDWKLVTKLDLFEMLDKNFMLNSDSLHDNLFHFQLSHTCNDTCSEYCKNNVANAKNSIFPELYKNTSIIDIAWNPSTMGTSNIVLDIGVFDLLSEKALDTLVTELAGKNISGIAQLGIMSLSSRLVATIDTNALVNNASYLNDGKVGVVEKTKNKLDIPKLIKTIGSVVNVVKENTTKVENGLNVNPDGISKLLEVFIGDKALLGKLTAKDIVNVILGDQIDTINFGGANGYGTPMIAEFASDKAVGYNVYEKAIKFNIDGNEKMTLKNGITMYGSMSLMGTSIVGRPALEITGVETTDSGVLKLYKINKNKFELVYNGEDKTMTPAQFKYDYHYGKDLFVKYNYIDFNKQAQSNYGAFYGFNNLDFENYDIQNTKVLTGFLTSGDTITKSMRDNLGVLLSMFGGGITLPELENIVPVASDMFDVKFILKESKVSDLKIEDNLKPAENGNITYAQGEEINLDATLSYKDGDTLKTATIIILYIVYN